jgi:glycine/D-amino acid oxidase-like deaminating enzyme
MLNDLRSHGLWERTAIAAPPTDQLSEDISTDVVIVGAGYTGLSAALHLARAGIHTVVLEAVEIGFGGAGRNVGLVNAGLWLRPAEVMATLGPVHGERVLDLLGKGPALVFDIIEKHGIACEAVRKGTLHCAVGDPGIHDLDERARQWQARGAPVHVLSAAETAAAVGSRAFAGALLDLRAGTIQPLAYARGLAHAALRAGAVIHTRSAVVEAVGTAGRWRLRTETGSVTAERVIFAGDAYSQGPWKRIRTEQIRVPYFNIATEPLPADIGATVLPGGEGAWDNKAVLSSFRLDAGGRLVFGSIGALRGTGTSVHRAWARRSVRKLFPHLGEVRFEAEWYGWMGMTTDNVPRFHELAPNVIGFSGYNGRGISPGTSFGQVLAHYVQGRLSKEELPLPVTRVDAPAFRAAREAFYEVGAQAAHLPLPLPT